MNYFSLYLARSKNGSLHHERMSVKEGRSSRTDRFDKIWWHHWDKVAHRGIPWKGNFDCQRFKRLRRVTLRDKVKYQLLRNNLIARNSYITLIDALKIALPYKL